MTHTALLLIDLQNDFCHQGALPVSGGDEVIDTANQVMLYFKQQQRPIIASQDWHPADHRSFAINSGGVVGESGELDGLPQVWWPVHCVQGSTGAAFHTKLHHHMIDKIIRKGQHRDVDSYSAFFDNGKRQSTELSTWLQQHQIQQLWIMGLATDYCVKFTVLDALALGYDVWIIPDGCRGVNLHPNDSQQALTEMVAKGAKLMNLSQAIARAAAVIPDS